jgi:hypothetical protein
MATKKLYSFDDHPEHREQLKPWAEKWIANALNCEAMTDTDRDAMRTAIDGLYRAANLEPPPAHRVIFVRSPIAGAVASAIAAAAWHIRQNPDKARAWFGRAPTELELMAAVRAATASAIDRCVRVLDGQKLRPIQLATRGATDGATDDATYGATRGATYGATRGATDDATDGATRGATYGATRGATDDATDDATDGATYDATDGATRGATRDATDGATDGATHGATYDATYGATHGATYDATYDATYGATYGATRGATRGATYDATYDATDGATRGATRGATYDATYGATDDATDGATYGATYGAKPSRVQDAVTIFLHQCIPHQWKFRNGGNMWSGSPAYLSFFRHVSKLEIDYSKWQHYEAAAIHAGPRFMHEKFCIISDRPLFVHRDEQNRAHCADGPHIKWRDGIELHHIHGIRVTPKVTAGEFTARDALEHPNAEVRRVMIERYNSGDAGRWLRDIEAKVVHEDTDELGGRRRLFRIDLPGDEPYVAVEVRNSTAEPDGGTYKTYTHRCDPELRPVAIPGFRERGEPQPWTCQNAIASTYAHYGREYRPLIQT